MKLHLGSGKNIFQGWTNVDIDPRADVICDLSKGTLPFKSDSVDIIYSEHFIEHINRSEGVALLKECHRVLKKSGTIRLSTPDLEVMFVEYSNKRIDKWHKLDFRPATPCQMVNESMRSWGHTFVYDFKELSDVFSEAGFLNTKTMPWHVSDSPVLSNIETRPSCGDLIVEAIK